MILPASPVPDPPAHQFYKTPPPPAISPDFSFNKPRPRLYTPTAKPHRFPRRLRRRDGSAAPNPGDPWPATFHYKSLQLSSSPSSRPPPRHRAFAVAALSPPPPLTPSPCRPLALSPSHLVTLSPSHLVILPCPSSPKTHKSAHNRTPPYFATVSNSFSSSACSLTGTTACGVTCRIRRRKNSLNGSSSE